MSTVQTPEETSIAFVTPPSRVDYAGGIESVLADTSSTNVETRRFSARDGLPNVDEFDIVVLTGSYVRLDGDHKWVEEVQADVRKRVAAGRPTVGVCFGHQLLASALGGRVESLPVGAAGYRHVELTDHGREHPLFEGVPSEFETFLWHLDHVTQVPDDSSVLARRGETVQAFALRDAPAVGIQFHPEVTPQLARELAAQADDSSPSGEAVIETLGDDTAEPARVSRRFYRNLVIAHERDEF
ncbi:type 1 glutamine amidotransferase (plasmid) [Haloferax sp. S1W]|uniref:type 1 glutamine amidotransferase n=1 Tax=Haloferax sp. S1W TaxID=3377110 RepID=UPI0037C875FA